MKNELVKKVASGIGKGIGISAIVVASLFGGAKAFANPSIQDLRALEQYAKQNGKEYIDTGNVHPGPFYVIKEGNYFLQAGKDYLMFVRDWAGGTDILYDSGKDGVADAEINVNGNVDTGYGGMLKGRALFGVNPNQMDIDMQGGWAVKQVDKENKAFNNRTEIYMTDKGIIMEFYKDNKAIFIPKGSNLAQIFTAGHGLGSYKSQEWKDADKFAAGLRDALGKDYDGFVNDMINQINQK
ncbi:MAG: hypothetical protein KGH55_01350 [Nanoarchaeota archaeon]|nr:hypothetical protein [Nanoarchaeota archaeon]